MDVNMIVAAGRDGAIGRGGDLVWHISSDLRRFRSLTMGHPVIMGRKTWDSLPRRPLPGRLNIVVSRNPGFIAEGATVVSSVEEALSLTDGESPFVMGGAQVYEAFMPRVTKIFLTEIDDECPDADARLPFPPDASRWVAEEVSDTQTTQEGLNYRFVTYRLRDNAGDVGLSSRDKSVI